jgi:hypothetical protein
MVDILIIYSVGFLLAFSSSFILFIRNNIDDGESFYLSLRIAMFWPLESLAGILILINYIWEELCQKIGDMILEKNIHF